MRKYILILVGIIGLVSNANEFASITVEEGLICGPAVLSTSRMLFHPTVSLLVFPSEINLGNKEQVSPLEKSCFWEKIKLRTQVEQISSSNHFPLMINLSFFFLGSGLKKKKVMDTLHFFTLETFFCKYLTKVEDV